MDLHNLQPFLTWIAEHPYLAGLAIFFIALSESLLIVGVLVPGAAMMVGIGTLIGTGAIDFWAAFAWSVLGAVVGDGISFWIGYYYRDRVGNFWFLSKRPWMLDKGKEFFQKHGGKSIVLGRFVGPIRAVIPAVAGMMHMRPATFFFVNVLSAIAWAPAYLLPGIIVGASVSAASQVTTRLAIMLVVLLVVGWILYVAVVRIAKLLDTLSDRVIYRTLFRNHHLAASDHAITSRVRRAKIYGTLIAVAMGGFGVYKAANILSGYETTDTDRLEHAISMNEWWQGQWQLLPRYRVDVNSDPQITMNIQWAGNKNEIETVLATNGWVSPVGWSLESILRSLDPSATVMQFPVLPQLHKGQREGILLVRTRDGDTNRQLIIRLYPSQYVTRESKTTIWVGNVRSRALQKVANVLAVTSLDNEVADVDTVFSESTAQSIEKVVVETDIQTRLLLVRSKEQME